METGLYHPSRRIPTWLALLALIIAVGISVLGLQQITGRPFTRATPAQTPQQVEISNITEFSFTVSWVTADPASGFIKYGANQQTELVARDARDRLTGEPANYATHWVTVTGLIAQTSYAFVIYSADNQYNNNGAPYTVTTASSPTLLDPATSTLIQGTVVTPDNQPASHALVYVRTAGLSPQSTFVDHTGSWSINLASARTSTLTTSFNSTNTTIFEAFIQGGGGRPNSSVTFFITNAQPLSQIILGQDYDFRSLNPTPSVAIGTSSTSGFALLALASGTPSPSPTPTTVLEVSPSPSFTPTPSLTPTLKPTATPTRLFPSIGSPTATPTPQPLPQAGLNWPTISLATVGILFFGLGVALLF